MVALMLGAAAPLSAEPALSALELRASNGNADAAYALGRAYKTGDGVAADSRVAERWFAKAAALGHAKAGAELGLVLHQNGKSAEALPWLKKAAEGGDARAQYTLGTIFYAGQAVPADAGQARRWMRKAAAAGLPAATEALAIMDKLPPVPMEEPPVTVAVRSTQPAEKAAQKTALPAPLPTLATGRWQAQLGAFSVAANASGYWRKLRNIEAAGLQATFPVRNGLTMLRVGPFASRIEARRFCTSQREQGRDCMEVAGGAE